MKEWKIFNRQSPVSYRSLQSLQESGCNEDSIHLPVFFCVLRLTILILTIRNAIHSMHKEIDDCFFLLHRTWNVWRRHGWMSLQSTFTSDGLSTDISQLVISLPRRNFASTLNVKISSGSWLQWLGMSPNIIHLWSLHLLHGGRWGIHKSDQI